MSRYEGPPRVTFIEFCTVAVILGILAAIVIPRLYPSDAELAWREACRKAGGTPYRAYRSERICLPPSAAIPIPVQP